MTSGTHRRTGPPVAGLAIQSLRLHHCTDPVRGLLVCPEIEIAETYEQMIASRVVEGVIFLGQGERPDVLRDLASTKMPFVTWGGHRTRPRRIAL